MRPSTAPRHIPFERIAVAGAVTEANVSLGAENIGMAAALKAAIDHVTNLERENTALRRLTAEQARTIATLTTRRA